MKISAVMAVYNGSKYIEEQLESIRTQTKGIDEFIIVDDCSTDDSVSIINAFISKYKLDWLIYRNNQNMGYIKTFHKALSLTTGDYIFLCDQDDIWKSNKVEKCIEVMANNKDILLLATTFDGIDEAGRDISVRSPILTENHGLIFFKKYKKNGLYKISERKIAERNISMGCTMVIKRELSMEYSREHLDASYDVPHDWELCIRAAMNNGLFFLNMPLIEYRLHQNNTVGIKSKSKEIDKKYRISEYKNYVKYYEEIMSWIPKENEDLKCTLSKWKVFFEKRVEALIQDDKKALIQLMATNIFNMKYNVLLIINDIKSVEK